MNAIQPSHKRVVLVYWKNEQEQQFEVFSNLKNFCLSYPKYNYNTLNNYLSKGKVPYENEEIHVERKVVFTQPKDTTSTSGNSSQITPVVRKVAMEEADDRIYDLEYWLSQPLNKRLEAVTFIISQSLKKRQRLDRTAVHHKLLKS